MNKQYTFAHDSGTTIEVIAPDNQSALNQLERHEIFKLVHKGQYFANLREWHLTGLQPDRRWIATLLLIIALGTLVYFYHPAASSEDDRWDNPPEYSE